MSRLQFGFYLIKSESMYQVDEVNKILLSPCQMEPSHFFLLSNWRWPQPPGSNSFVLTGVVSEILPLRSKPEKKLHTVSSDKKMQLGKRLLHDGLAP